MIELINSFKSTLSTLNSIQSQHQIELNWIVRNPEDIRDAVKTSAYTWFKKQAKSTLLWWKETVITDSSKIPKKDDSAARGGCSGILSGV
jgi:hypothetical protein